MTEAESVKGAGAVAIQEGDTLPEFTLPADNGDSLSLADCLGRPSVFYFYPKDDTPQCTKQAQSFRDLMAEYAAAGIQVIGVSPDSVSSHGKFKNKHALNFTLIADNDAKLAQVFGVWVEKNMYGRKYMGVERATFLVDRNGIVRKTWRKVKVPGHAAEVLDHARTI